MADHAKLSKTKLRRAIADYMWSEGCSCCRNIEAHNAHSETLAKMLGVRRHSDGSGYDWYAYRTNPDA